MSESVVQPTPGREPDERQWELDKPFLEANAFIQWKGTDVCMDFRCTCGGSFHFDGFFAYAVQCGDCGTIWEMPSKVFPRRVAPERCADLCIQHLRDE